MFRKEAAELGALKDDPKVKDLTNGIQGNGASSSGGTQPGKADSSRKDSTNGKASNGSPSGGSDPGSKDDEERPRHILFLGSSLGNFDRSETAPFLSTLPLRPGSQDTLLIGLDGRPSAVKQVQSGGMKTPLSTVTDITRPSTPDYFQGQKKVEIAYDDPKGKTRDFIMHGLEVVDQELKGANAQDGQSATGGIDLGAWEYKSRYDIRLGK
jgi:hypothetical protein